MRKTKYQVSVGETYGELSVKEIIVGVPQPIICICSCGSTVKTSRAYLAKGLAKRCAGCRNAANADKWRIEPGMAARTEIYNDYAHSARKRGIDWNISKDDFYPLLVLHCTYCGRPPSSEKKTNRINNGTFVYNGVDRVDNSRGYHPDNVTTCCKTCNYMKRDMDHGEFLAHVRAIVAHQEGK